MKKGKRYAELTKLVDRTNNYDPQEAVALVKKLARALLYSRLFSIYEIACNIKSCKVMVQKVTLEDK